jgi:kynureninase
MRANQGRIGTFHLGYLSSSDLKLDYIPIPGAAGFQLSNPCVLAVTAFLASLQIFHETTIEELRSKSILLTSYLALLLNEDPLLKTRLEILTPMNPLLRGCQLSISFRDARVQELQAKLLSLGIVVDVREPNVMRVAPVPLYNTFHDVWTFFSAIQGIMRQTLE